MCFARHDIGYFFYNGGNDSMDTAQKVSEVAVQMNYPIACIGIPKTVDNDLPITDCCPGFGSAASTSQYQRVKPRSMSPRWHAPPPRCSCSR